MIHASLDDFGKCDGKEHIAGVAGYVAYKEDWEHFNRGWGQALSSNNIPFLHTAEYLQSIPLIGGGGLTDSAIAFGAIQFVPSLVHILAINVSDVGTFGSTQLGWNYFAARQ